MLISEYKKGDFIFSMNEFETLENNVGRAIRLIQKFSAKNEELKNENQRLKQTIFEHEKTIQSKSEEISHIKKEAKDNHYFREKEEKIRLKIQQIIEKLDSLERLSNNQ